MQRVRFKTSQKTDLKPSIFELEGISGQARSLELHPMQPPALYCSSKNSRPLPIVSRFLKALLIWELPANHQVE
jgi:hypothetical protein